MDTYIIALAVALVCAAIFYLAVKPKKTETEGEAVFKEDTSALKKSVKDWEKLSTEVWQAKRDLQLLMKELQSASTVAVKEIEDKIVLADRLAQLLAETLAKVDVAKPSGLAVASSESSNNGRYEQVYHLADQGYTVHEIARQLSMGNGEVALILQLRQWGKRKAQ